MHGNIIDKSVNKLATISGILWLATDIFWYWELNVVAFLIGFGTMISTACLFANKRLNVSLGSKFLVLLLNIWLWINMLSLTKDAFDPHPYVCYLINTISFGLCVIAVAIVIGLFKIERNAFERFKRF